MTTSRKKTTRTTRQPGRIMLGTNPDIASANRLYQRLKKSADRKTDVNLYADKVETIDTTTLQLLLAFIRQVRDNGNVVNWKSTSAVLLKTASLTGLQTALLLGEAAS